MNLDELIVDIRFEIEDARAKFDMEIAKLKEKSIKYQKDINKLTVANARTRARIAEKMLDPRLTAFQKRSQTREYKRGIVARNLKIAETRKLLKANQLEIAKVTNEYKNSYATQKKLLAETQKKISEFRKPFAGFAMSIMFFGMAVQRIFGSIRKFGSKSFEEVTSSVDGTVTGANRLEGSLKFLGFTIGSALDPFAEKLIPIIDNISTWIDENPRLTGTLIVLGEVLGGLMAAGGALVLAKRGFQELLGLTKMLDKADFARIGTRIRKGIGIIAIGYSLKMLNDAGKAFKQDRFYDGLAKSLGGAALAFGGYRMMVGKKGGGALIAIGVALDLVAENKFFKTVFGSFNIIWAYFKTLGEKMRNNFRNNIWEGIVTSFADAIDHLSYTFGVGFVRDILGLKNLGQTVRDKFKAEPFDFSTAYSKNLASMNSYSNFLDIQLDLMKRGWGGYVSGQSVNGNNQWVINIDKVVANGDSDVIQSIYDEIKRYDPNASIVM